MTITHSLRRVVTLLACMIIPEASMAQEPLPSARAIVRAVNEAWISTDLTARVQSVGFRENQSFAKGDVLITFDCSDLTAQLRAAEAVLRGAWLTADNNAHLAKLNATGKLEVDLSRTKTEQAAAEVEALRNKISHCTIYAPFDGYVAALRVHAFEFPDKTAPLMQIIGRSDMEIDVLLPSPWLRWLKVDMPFDVAIEETGATMSAVVSRIGAVVDPVSQTVKVTGRFSGAAPSILPGMSGPASFAEIEAQSVKQ